MAKMPKETFNLLCCLPRLRCSIEGIVRALVPSTTEINLIKARAGFTKFEIVTDQRGLKQSRVQPNSASRSVFMLRTSQAR